MRNGVIDLEILVEKNTTDEISLLNGNQHIEIPLGGRPGNFEKYYDAKTGWPGDGNFGGKVYFTYSQLVAIKVALLEKRRLIGKSDVNLQGALGLIFQALGEVDPYEG